MTTPGIGQPPSTAPAQGTQAPKLDLLDVLEAALAKKYGANLGQELSGAKKAPSAAKESVDSSKLGFQGVKKSKEDPYLDASGNVAEVKEPEAAKGSFQAKIELEKLKEETKNNMDSKGIDALLAAGAKDAPAAKMDKSTYEKFGLDTGFFGGLSDKGEAQLESLKKREIVDKDGNIKKDLNADQIKYLESQKAANTKKAETEKIAKGDISSFAKQVKMDGLSEDQVKKIMTVDDLGQVTLDLSKLDAEQYKALSKSGKGIEYGGSGALTLKDNEGLDMKVNLTGDANHVNLEGKASADITTQNKALQIKGDKDTKVSCLQGNNLEQLVVDGGTVDSRLDRMNNLEAVSFKNTTLTNGINLTNNNKDQSVVLNMQNSQVGEGQDVKVRATKDASISAANSTTGNIDVAAQKISTRLKGVKAGDVKIQAEKEAFAVFSDGTKAKEVAAKAEDLTMSYLSDSEAAKTDLSGVKGKTKLFVGNTSAVGDLSLKKGATDKDVELAGNEDSAKELTDATGIKARTHGEKTDSETISDKYFNLAYLGLTGGDYDKKVQAQEDADTKAEYEAALEAAQPKKQEKKWTMANSLNVGNQFANIYNATHPLSNNGGFYS